MNLHEIVSPMVGAVNPHVPGAWRRSTGYAITAAGKSVPAYAAPMDDCSAFVRAELMLTY